MAGASRTHADVVVNIIQRLLNSLGPGGCRPAASDLRVQVTPAGPYTYPDVLVYCKDAVWLGARPGHDWVLTEIDGKEGVLSLSSLPISLSLEDIYTDIELNAATLDHLQ
jgi:hypothetical protein